MVSVPGFLADTKPMVPVALLTPTTDEPDVLHLPMAVMSISVPSLYIAVAVNCSTLLSTILGLGGVIAIDTSVKFVTVRSVEPKTPSSVAVIVVVPTLTELAEPSLPAALLIVAVAGLLEFQVTAVVRSWVELSENVPVAVNC